MKVSKEALRTARQLLRLSMKDGRIDAEASRRIAAAVIKAKPRHYIATLEAYQRMLRLELEKRHAIVETAVALNDSERESVLSDLKGRLGTDITADFRDVPDLLGGMRVKLGSTVWDSSIKARLEGLSRSLQS